MSDTENTTTHDSWFAHASLNSRISYILAAAAADRYTSYQYWLSELDRHGRDGTTDSEAYRTAATLAGDARAVYDNIVEMQSQFRDGEFAVTKPQDITCPACSETFTYRP
jgi:hypothetical protein